MEVYFNAVAGFLRKAMRSFGCIGYKLQNFSDQFAFDNIASLAKSILQKLRGSFPECQIPKRRREIGWDQNYEIFCCSSNMKTKDNNCIGFAKEIGESLFDSSKPANV